MTLKDLEIVAADMGLRMTIRQSGRRQVADLITPAGCVWKRSSHRSAGFYLEAGRMVGGERRDFFQWAKKGFSKDVVVHPDPAF